VTFFNRIVLGEVTDRNGEDGRRVTMNGRHTFISAQTGDPDLGSKTETVKPVALKNDHGEAIKVGKGWIIGVDHGRRLDLNDKSKLAAVVKAAREGGVHFEGPEPEQAVLSFAKRVLKTKTGESWEPPLDRESLPLVLGVFSQPTETLRKQVEDHPKFDPKASIIDNLVKTQDAWDSIGGVSRGDIEAMLKIASGDKKARTINPDSERLPELANQGMESFDRFHKAGFETAYPEDFGLPEDHTKLGAMAWSADSLRDKALIRRVSQGGVAIAGSSHLAYVRRLLGTKS